MPNLNFSKEYKSEKQLIIINHNDCSCVWEDNIKPNYKLINSFPKLKPFFTVSVSLISCCAIFLSKRRRTWLLIKQVLDYWLSNLASNILCTCTLYRVFQKSCKDVSFESFQSNQNQSLNFPTMWVSLSTFSRFPPCNAISEAGALPSAHIQKYKHLSHFSISAFQYFKF